MFNQPQVFSGSYNFSPNSGEIILNAFMRIQIRPTEVLTTHIQQAVMELNLVLVKFSNLVPNLWTVDLQSLPLVQGSATYSLPAETVMVTDAFVRTGTGIAQNDRMIFPISRTEYAALPNKNVQAPPTQFWFDRLISPTITFYPTPDGNGPYVVEYFRITQMQDATLANGVNVTTPYRFLDAVVAGLAHRLARLYAPQLEMVRKADADEAWQIAATQDTENVAMMVWPGMTGYWR